MLSRSRGAPRPHEAAGVGDFRREFGLYPSTSADEPTCPRGSGKLTGSFEASRRTEQKLELFVGDDLAAR